MEKENEIINTKLNSIRQELSDATTNLTKFSGENISLRQANYEFQGKTLLWLMLLTFPSPNSVKKKKKTQ